MTSDPDSAPPSLPAGQARVLAFEPEALLRGEQGWRELGVTERPIEITRKPSAPEGAQADAGD